MWSFFNFDPRPLNLRNGEAIRILPTRLAHYGVSLLLFRGTLVWNSLTGWVKTIVI